MQSNINTGNIICAILPFKVSIIDLVECLKICPVKEIPTGSRSGSSANA